MKKESNEPFSDKIKKQLVSLGCSEIRKGIFRHPDFIFDFDFSATGDNFVLLRLSQIFEEKAEFIQKNLLKNNSQRT